MHGSGFLFGIPTESRLSKIVKRLSSQEEFDRTSVSVCVGWLGEVLLSLPPVMFCYLHPPEPCQNLVLNVPNDSGLVVDSNQA